MQIDIGNGKVVDLETNKDGPLIFSVDSTEIEDGLKEFNFTHKFKNYNEYLNTRKKIREGLGIMGEKFDLYDRIEILELAKEAVDGSRGYGNVESNFDLIARFWSDYKTMVFTAKDVAIMMMLLKIARATTGANNIDNYVDIAGYAACAGECEE